MEEDLRREKEEEERPRRGLVVVVEVRRWLGCKGFGREGLEEGVEGFLAGG